jgi:hypothetical protein
MTFSKCKFKVNTLISLTITIGRYFSLFYEREILHEIVRLFSHVLQYKLGSLENIIPQIQIVQSGSLVCATWAWNLLRYHALRHQLASLRSFGQCSTPCSPGNMGWNIIRVDHARQHAWQQHGRQNINSIDEWWIIWLNDVKPGAFSKFWSKFWKMLSL